ncbi:MAG: hypothetical protein ACQEP9_04025 [Bacillota bacterium]
MDFKVKRYSVFLGGDHMGIEVITDIGSFENIVFGIARAKNEVTTYNRHYFDKVIILLNFAGK